ncbi:MAG: hypothetical protein Q8P15_03870 [Nanoarchaeota archaeon]|nr:hypothetical protein [Nanoarchaeota archaeon]
MKEKKIKLQMEFNPGLQKYEPKLPLKKSKGKINFNWKIFILILMGIALFGFLFYYLLP